MLELEELDRRKYLRQITLPGFGEEAQRKLKNASALVARAGGLGGPVALYLAAAGIGRLVILHGGNLTWTNLNRQILQAQDWVGKPRADKIRESILRLNHDIDLTVVPEDPDDRNLDTWAPTVDILCDCPPTYEERFAMNRASLRHRKPMVEAGMSDMEGILTVFVPGQTACMECLCPEVPPEWSGSKFPVLGAVSGALGCLAAIEAIKVLTGFGEPLTGELLTMDTLRHTYRKLKLPRDPHCRACSGIG